MFSGKFLVTSFLFFFLSPVCFGVEFVSLEDAMAAAKERDSKIYILITSDRCSWCDKQKDVISSDRVSDAMADFVSCRIDAGSEEAKRYKSRAVPVSIVADRDGLPLKKNVGYMDEAKFMSWLK